MDISSSLDDFRNWVPIRFYRDGERPFVDWCYMGTQRFTRPFFDDSINARLGHPFSLLFRHQTPIEFLGRMYGESPGLPPTGFIFHMSRCGSTLVSQMLASIDKNIVISEPPPVDAVLRADTRGRLESEETRLIWLRWMINAFGQKRYPGEEYLFIKFDSWSTTDLGLIRRAFPDVPWIFLYRNPVEVIVSQMNQRGAQMIPGVIQGILPGVDTEELLQMPHEEYCARVLERLCRAALQHRHDPQALFVNYTELPDAVTAAIVKHFCLEFSPGELETMRQTARFNAKTPQLDFEPDTENKTQSASVEVRLAAERWVDPFYRQLESARSTPAV